MTACGNKQAQSAETPATDSIQVDSTAQEEETTYFPAIHRYLVDSISSQYAEADIRVPLPTVVAVDESNGEDIKVWGDKYDAFVAIYSDHEKRNRHHEELLSEYVRKHHLTATMYQDNGQDAKPLNR